MEPNSLAGKFRATFAFVLLFPDVSPEKLTPYFAVHAGQRYENVTMEFKGLSLGDCHMYCANEEESPCYAFNYRETDDSCQLILKGNNSLVASEGYQSFVQSEL